ncbi:MAG: exo-alpha-sialidase, partial [Bacteroidales bacterium]|nr:exo-alpha-sialidase [Bacteroidales bacterium]
STPKTVPYVWKNVPYVGGGFVDGIVFHPTKKGLCYCRTDMGGAYRRNPKTLRWEPLLDWLSYADRNLMGVESIALDPSDPNLLYLSCGTYTNPRTPNGAILRSNNRGRTFMRTDVPFKMGGNEDGRGNGERMMVDPNNGNIIYLGTRHAGLWKSTDAAVTWTRVESFPDVTESAPAGMHDADSIARWLRTNRGSGIIFVLFDSQSGSIGKGSKVIYAGVSLMNRDNIYRSKDGGESWQPLPDQPVHYRPTHAVFATDGTLYITYGNHPGPTRMTDGGVWKFNTKNNEWKEITPDKPNPATRAFGYAAVAVQHNNPEVLIVSSFNRYLVDNGEDIFRSTDGGKTWKKVFGNGGKIDSQLAPYTAHTGIHWLFDLEIDPFNPDHALFTTGYGGHETFNLTAMDKSKPTIWGIMSTGIEETVPLELLSPPKGAHLITAIGDYGGAVHWNLDQPASDNFSNPRFGNTNGIACAESKPEIIVRVGRATEDNPGKTIGYSLNSGRSWSPTDTLPHPLAALGDIAVSADGSAWIWSPDPVGGGYGPGSRRQVLPVYVTADMGKTWNECNSIPGNTRVIADRVNPKVFYGIDIFSGKLFISHDAGKTFNIQAFELPGGLPAQSADRGDNRGGQDKIYTTPGKEGELWLAAFDGLYRSKNAGKAFNQMPDVEEIHGFGFGKGISEDYPALYLIGTISGIRGIFRSDDVATTWARINDDQHQWGLLMHITGDPKKYGRVYVGTHGRGTLYGEPL